VQSGDNDVLTAMRRRHTREEVINVCKEITKKRGGVVLGCDLIAGFPTETESMFQNTLKLIDDAKFSLMHIFPYSKRDGTLAATMPQLPRKIILERTKILHKKADCVRRSLFNSLIGQEISGIVEKTKDGNSYGKTDSFIKFKLQSRQYKPGNVIETMKIIGCNENTMLLCVDLL
jgi:threonylcarbamoyladenosine tRNA methylthiotransferase MtaB